MLNKVEICGVNTAKLPVLPNDKINELFVAAQQGDKEAREELIAGNLRLVLSVIQRFNNRGENADDLFQVGCIGLIKAIDNFDTTQCKDEIIETVSRFTRKSTLRNPVIEPEILIIE